jgi:hypothetical protein
VGQPSLLDPADQVGPLIEREEIAIALQHPGRLGVAGEIVRSVSGARHSLARAVRMEAP